MNVMEEPEQIGLFLMKFNPADVGCLQKHTICYNTFNHVIIAKKQFDSSM